MFHVGFCWLLPPQRVIDRIRNGRNLSHILFEWRFCWGPFEYGREKSPFTSVYSLPSTSFPVCIALEKDPCLMNQSLCIPRTAGETKGCWRNGEIGSPHVGFPTRRRILYMEKPRTRSGIGLRGFLLEKKKDFPSSSSSLQNPRFIRKIFKNYSSIREMLKVWRGHKRLLSPTQYFHHSIVSFTKFTKE